MENKILAIRGHNTRGKEVIEILEMLGGEKRILKGNDTHCFYYISTDNNIIRLGHANYCNLNDFVIFTLEEFLEKYPYKVGDKVQEKGSAHCDSVYIIEDMVWEKDHIDYIIRNQHHEYPKSTVTVEYLQPYEEEIKEEDNTNIYINPDIDNKTTCDIKINGMQVNINDYTVKSITKTDDGLIVEYIKNKQYPKTYEECEKVLRYDSHRLDDMGVTVKGYKWELIRAFQQLLICRDAYWKFEGDWEEKRKKEINHYVIYSTLNGGLVKDCLSCTMVKHLLDFPTKEMRDAFYENFKDLIEQCKEFL